MATLNTFIHSNRIEIKAIEPQLASRLQSKRYGNRRFSVTDVLMPFQRRTLIRRFHK